MAATEAIEFNGIFQENIGALQDGYLKLSKQNVLFKNASTGRLQTIPVDDVEGIYWQKLGNKPGMKLAMRDGVHHRFGGFKENDFNKLSTFAQSKWNQPVAKQELCIKGWNYGEAKFEGRNLEFDVDNRPAFEIPLSNVSHCTGTKTEIILEFHQNDDCPVQLSEMRLHIPQKETDKEKEKGNEVQNNEEGGVQRDDPVEEFRQAVMRYAEVETEAGQPLTILQEILLATPRGRYEIKIFQNHLSLRGKTYDYKIQMKQIQRMFLLPHQDGRQMFFAININPPIRQGLTKYPFLVIECSRDDEVELDLGGMTPEQLKEQYQGKLEPHMKGRLYEEMAKLFRTLVNQRITIPGNFTGASGTPAISCAHRQSTGWLYPLEKGFIYIYKPTMYIRFEEIDNVNFGRNEVSTRSFDFELMLRDGNPVTFSSVGKEEYNKLFDYVKTKGLKIRNATRIDKPMYKEDRFADSDEEEVDHYKEGLKADARQRGRAPSNDSEEDSEDEDYDLEADEKRKKRAREEDSSNSEGSGSEPEEEYSTGGDSDVSDDLAGKSSKKKTTKKDKPKKSGGEASTSKAASASASTSSPSKKPPTSKEFINASDEEDSSDDSDAGAKGSKKAGGSGQPPSKKAKGQEKAKKKGKPARKASSEEEEESSAGSTPGSEDDD